MDDGEVGEHARRDDARVVVALLHALVVVGVRVDLERIEAHAAGEVRHRAKVADLGEAERGLGLPVDVRLRARCNCTSAFAGARIGELAQHVEELLGLVPGRLGLLLGDAAEREDEALAADAVAQRLEELLAAVLVGVLERLEQRAARLVVGDLAETGGGLARDSMTGSCTSLMSVSVYLGSALRESTVATSWRTDSLSSPASSRARRARPGCAMSSGLKAGPPPRRWTLVRKPFAVLVHRLVEHARLVQRHERPGDLRAVGVVGFEERLLQRIFAGVGLGRAEVREHLRGDAADAVIGLGERFDRERDAVLVAFPAELHERFLLELVLFGLHRRARATWGCGRPCGRT